MIALLDKYYDYFEDCEYLDGMSKLILRLFETLKEDELPLLARHHFIKCLAKHLLKAWYQGVSDGKEVWKAASQLTMMVANQ